MITFTSHLRGIGRHCWIGVLTCDALSCTVSVEGFSDVTSDPDAPPQREHILRLRVYAQARGWSSSPDGIYCPNCAPTHAMPYNDRR